MHHPVHTVVLVYLLMVAVLAVLLLLLVAGQTLGGRLWRRASHDKHGHGSRNDEVDEAVAGARRPETGDRSA